MLSEHNDTEYKNLRPAVAFDASSALPVEAFQGLVLRPLFKQYNHELIEAFIRALGKSKSRYLTSNEKDRVTLIHLIVTTKQTFRNNVFLLLRKHCTKSELDFIQVHRREVSKRITVLLAERLRTQHDSILQKINGL